MTPEIIGIKQLHQELPRIARATARGKSFVVVKHARPLFRLVPFTAQPHTLDDLLKLQFKSRDKNLSENIDKIVYGV